MNETVQPAKTYRDRLRNGLRSYQPSAGEDQDQDFRIFLERLYKEEKAKFEKQSETGIGGDQMTVFLLSVGLFTYGRLDVFEDILDNIPAPRNMRRLAWVLRALLPMPNTLDPLQDANAVKLWINTNRTKLDWHEDEGKFVLKQAE